MRASVKTTAAVALLSLAGLAWWALRDGSGPSGGSRPEQDSASDASGADGDGGPGDATRGVRVPRPHSDGGRDVGNDPGGASGGDSADGGRAETPGSSGQDGDPDAPDGTTAGSSPTDVGDPTAPQHENLPEGPAAIGEVVGKVLLFPDRSPMEGVVVRVLGGGPGRDVAPFPEPGRCTTGPNGVFRIAGFAPGTYSFEAALKGRAARKFRVTFTSTEAPDEVEVLFGAGGGVEGRVFTSAGPAEGVTVRINPSGIGGGRGLLSTVTDASGGYRLDDLPPGSYGVEVDTGGRFRSRTAAVTVMPGETARLDFPSESSLAGVLTVDGEPLEGVIVRATRTGRGYRSQQARTGKDGSFLVEGLEPTEYRIAVQVLAAPGFAVDVEVVTLTAGENRIDLLLGQGDLAGGVEGRVSVEATGGPPPQRTQIAIQAMSGDAEDLWGSAAQVALLFPDETGAFRVLGLRPGRYGIVVRPYGGGLQSARLDVTLTWGERKTGLEIRLKARESRETPEETPSVSVLSGVVTDGGRPLSGAYVRAHADADGERYRQATTDGTGRFLLERLDPGTWRVNVQVVGKGGFSAEAAEVKVVEGKNRLDIALDEGDLTGQVLGRVTARQTGKPLSSKDVSLLLNVRGADGTGRNVGMAWPEPDGKFRFRCVRGGAYRILAYPSAGSLQKQEIDVDVLPGQQRDGVEIALDALPTGSVRLVVRDEAGKPVLRAKVLSMLDGEPRQGSMTANSNSGVYETHFEAGVHEITVSDWGDSISARVTVDVREGETTEVEVVLRPKSE